MNNMVRYARAAEIMRKFHKEKKSWKELEQYCKENKNEYTEIITERFYDMIGEEFEEYQKELEL